VKQFHFRLNSWPGIWLGIGALLAGAVLLWVGFALAMVLTVFAGLALLPAWMRRWWTGKTAPRGPVTIEGHCTKINQ
jgi:membrane protein implicated in regulation of membrane protease activity